MDWEKLLAYILESLVVLLTTVVLSYGASLLKKKVKNEEISRLIDRATKIVADSVLLINQTYVDALKQEGKFDKIAQAKAFEKCKQKVLALLSVEAREAIYATYGDFEQWLKTTIEANVRNEKYTGYLTNDLLEIDESSEKPIAEHE